MCSNLKGFSEDLITNPSSSYPGQLFNISVYYFFNISVYYLYLHFEKRQNVQIIIIDIPFICVKNNAPVKR